MDERPITARSRMGALVALILLAGCQAVPPPRAAPPPPPPPAPAPTPTPSPTPVAQSSLNWEEAPVTAGNWRYMPRGRARAASFGSGENDDRLVIACAADSRQISLLIVGATARPGQPVTVRTSFGASSWAGSAAPANGPAGLLITRAATDPGLDQIAYSRGRIAIEAPGSARLVVPAWAEISRVIEDCRN